MRRKALVALKKVTTEQCMRRNHDKPHRIGKPAKPVIKHSSTT
jgi:hypothetical protein